MLLPKFSLLQPLSGTGSKGVFIDYEYPLNTPKIQTTELERLKRCGHPKTLG